MTDVHLESDSAKQTAPKIGQTSGHVEVKQAAEGYDESHQTNRAIQNTAGQASTRIDPRAKKVGPCSGILIV